MTLASLLCAPGLAQGAGSEPDEPREGTVVSARKIEEELLDVPRSATVIDAETLEDAGITRVHDAAIYVPNLRLTEFTAQRLSFPFIRGIGSGQGDPSVITYIDGVPQLGTGGTNLPLLDVQRVEFLRGPQSTLFGRDALGGLIHVVTARPSRELEHSAGITYGSFDLFSVEARGSGPIGGSGVSFSGSADYTTRDGYTENDFDGDTVDDREGFFGRGQVLFAPSDDSEVRVTLFGQRARDGAFGLSFLEDQNFGLFTVTGLRNRPHRINQDFSGQTHRDVYSPSVTWDLYGDRVDLTSITSYQHYDIRESTDFDFTPVDGVVRRTHEGQEYLYQEIRLASAEDTAHQLSDGIDVRWVAGVSAFHSDADRSALNEFRPGGAGIFFPPGMDGFDATSGDFTDTGLALFGQTTFTFDEHLDVTTGLRWDYQSTDADLEQTFQQGGFTLFNSQTSADESFDEVLPTVSVAYRFTEELLGYVSAARGFKAGGFNLRAPVGFESFEPETSWTYELGVKKSWDDDRYRLSAAAFAIDWEDMQLSQFDPMAGGFVTNAGESTSTGFELEGAGGVTEDLDLFAGLGFLDTEFDQFTDQFGQDVSGNDLPFAPEHTWSLGAQYGGQVADGDWYVRGEYAATGDFFYDASNLGEEDFAVANFRVGYEARRWQLDFWVRNAFDEEYIPIAFQASPADPTLFVGENGAPRTVGVTLSGGI